ncbi:MAG: hypothetical protein HEQ19_04960 [Gloeotrichia echinulata CP02]|jgi:hypothetical protein
MGHGAWGIEESHQYAVKYYVDVILADFSGDRSFEQNSNAIAITAEVPWRLEIAATQAKPASAG